MASPVVALPMLNVPLPQLPPGASAVEKNKAQMMAIIQVRTSLSWSTTMIQVELMMRCCRGASR